MHLLYKAIPLTLATQLAHILFWVPCLIFQMYQGFLHLKPVEFFLILHSHQPIIIIVLPKLLSRGWNLDKLSLLFVNCLSTEVEQMTSFCPVSCSPLPACWLQLKGGNKQLECTYILNCHSCLQLTLHGCIILQPMPASEKNYEFLLLCYPLGITALTECERPLFLSPAQPKGLYFEMH